LYIHNIPPSYNNITQIIKPETHFPLFLSLSLSLSLSLILIITYFINVATASFSVTNAPRFLLPLACRTVDTAHDYAQESATLLFADDVDQGSNALDGQAERREYRVSVPL